MSSKKDPQSRRQAENQVQPPRIPRRSRPRSRRHRPAGAGSRGVSRTGQCLRSRTGSRFPDINGKPVNLTIEPRVTLLDALRNYMEAPLTGAKRVCDRGTCGACTVLRERQGRLRLLDAGDRRAGQEDQDHRGPARSRQAASRSPSWRTTRSSAATARLASSWRPRIPGTKSKPDSEQVKSGLGGNLCRCGTYVGIRKAVLEAAKT